MYEVVRTDNRDSSSATDDECRCPKCGGRKRKEEEEIDSMWAKIARWSRRRWAKENPFEDCIDADLGNGF